MYVLEIDFILIFSRVGYPRSGPISVHPFLKHFPLYVIVLADSLFAGYQILIFFLAKSILSLQNSGELSAYKHDASFEPCGGCSFAYKAFMGASIATRTNAVSAFSIVRNLISLIID